MPCLTSIQSAETDRLRQVPADEIDRPEEFTRRLSLGSHTSALDQRDFPGAKAACLRIVQAYGRGPAPAFAAFRALPGFNIRRLYDIGH